MSAHRELVREVLAPRAAAIDAAGSIPREVLDALAAGGVMAVPEDELELGELAAELGAACTSTRSVLTVHWMVSRAIARWGSDEQRDRWLPALASGATLAAFCLTEPEVGSDGGAVRATLREDGDGWILDGRKLWVTGARLAGVYLVLARAGDRPTAVLVPRDAPGLRLEGVDGQLGLRGAMLAEVVLDGCRVPRSHTVGPVGFGWTHTAATALDHGRYTVAWGSLGIAGACLRAAALHASRREQFGAPIAEHQLVRRLLGETTAAVAAARAVCREAARSRQERSPSALHDTMVAKYVASRAAGQAADAAVQVHGAAGVAAGAGVERHFRDARIMRIIEGSDEMQQLALAEPALREAASS